MEYPKLAAAAHVTGYVTIRCNLDADGKVISTERLDSNQRTDLLADAARENARQWLFQSNNAESLKFIVLKYDFSFEDRAIQRRTILGSFTNLRSPYALLLSFRRRKFTSVTQ